MIKNLKCLKRFLDDPVGRWLPEKDPETGTAFKTSQNLLIVTGKLKGTDSCVTMIETPQVRIRLFLISSSNCNTWKVLILKYVTFVSAALFLSVQKFYDHTTRTTIMGNYTPPLNFLKFTPSQTVREDDLSISNEMNWLESTKKY